MTVVEIVLKLGKTVTETWATTFDKELPREKLEQYTLYQDVPFGGSINRYFYNFELEAYENGVARMKPLEIKRSSSLYRNLPKWGFEKVAA